MTLSSLPHARAVEVSLRLDPAVAFPLRGRQGTHFNIGGAVGAAVGILPASFFELHLAGQFIALPGGTRAGGIGPIGPTAFVWGAGGGIRLQRPHNSEGFFFPWVDGDFGYVRNGDLDSKGFAVGVGIAVPASPGRELWMGPFVRYTQDLDPDAVAPNAAPSYILLGGLSFELSWPAPRPVARPEPAPAPPPPPPPPPAVRDRDGDGIPDEEDACPDQPGPKQTGGCPDRDGDGIPDKDDACPDQAGPKQTGGCPDRDNDGVADKDDNCPDVPGPAENHGCPESKMVKVTGEKLEIAQKIYFANNQARILPRSFPLLDEVAKVLGEHSAIKVRIEGHTDSRGSASHNQQLSEERAAAVEQYLIKKGVPEARLSSKGYGSSMPVADNKTAIGRENNRRVEFVVVGQEGTP